MTTNCLLVGPPRSGKTTVLERTADRLAERGWTVGGIACPEIRQDGRRVGFHIVDRRTETSRRMATRDEDGTPRVGSYVVDVDAIDTVAERELADPTGVDCLLIDEIGPMQLHSDRFVTATRTSLDAATPVVATLKADYEAGLAGTVRERSDVTTRRVSPETRETLPGTLESWLTGNTD